jgi:tetratricopeptide (TPR) repeat protein
MTMEARTAELDRGVADAAKGTAGEAAFAMALRAQRLGRPDEARSLFRTARQLLPGDPWVGYYATLGLLGTNSTPAEVLVAQQRLTTQFPDLAPAYNNLAYGLYRAGDRAGGLEAIRKYAELAPNHPNAKDSYAELLQWEGRLDEAVALYRDAARLEPSYGAAFTGIADARQLQGRGADARAALGEGLAGATTPAAKANLHRLIALSFAADGDRKGAEAALAAAMSEANAAGGAGLISGVHRDFAQVLVMAGDKGGVASHLAATTNPNPLLLAVDAMMLAAAGLNAEAKAKLQEAERGADADGNDNARARFPIVRALILVNEGSGEAALAEIAKGNITLPTAKAVMALAEQQRKNTPVARMLRDGVRSDMVYALGNRELALARSLAARVK